MAAEVLFATGQLASDTSNVDVTIGGETRTPSGALFIATSATALDTTTADYSISIGVTDFTTSAYVSSTSEDAQTTTDTSRNHGEAHVIALLTPGATATFDRQATATAITGGVRVTCDGSGTQYRFAVALFFDMEVKAFSAGDTTATTSTFAVAHGLSGKPQAGIMTYGGVHTEGNVQSAPHIGFFSDDGSIVQNSTTVRAQNGQADGENHGKIFTTRVASLQDNSAGTLQEITLTGNDATNTTFTNDGSNTLTGDLVGLLLYHSTLQAKAQVSDSSDNAGADWSVTGAGFQPTSVLMALTNFTATDAGVGDDEIGGSFGICGFDASTIVSACVSEENAATPTNSNSRLAQALYLLNDNAVVDYNMDNPSFDSDGFTFAAADQTTADGTTHKFPTLFLGASSSVALMRRRRIDSGQVLL